MNNNLVIVCSLLALQGCNDTHVPDKNVACINGVSYTIVRGFIGAPLLDSNSKIVPCNQSYYIGTDYCNKSLPCPQGHTSPYRATQ
jgi:hypothetical protein